MLIQGSALLHSFTVEFSLHGDDGNWKATVKAPGHLSLEREACDTTPYLLLEEMLAAAFDACRRNFPDRWPKSPEPAPIQKHKAQLQARRR